MSNYSEAQIADLKATLEAIHPLTCEARHQHTWNECRSMSILSNGATIDAIEHLRTAPRDAAGARGILHDAACMSGCSGASRDEHANRQAKTIAALRKHLAGKL